MLLIEISKKLFRLIQAVIHNEHQLNINISEKEWLQILSLAQKHNLVVLLASSLELLDDSSKPSNEITDNLDQLMLYEVIKSENQLSAIQELEVAFNKNYLKLLPLKGCNTKHRYPSPESRQMGDIDILYDAEQTSEVRRLMESLGYVDFVEGRMHDSYKLPPFVCVELHRSLVSESSSFSDYYKGVLQRCKLKGDYQSVYEMSIEDEFVFNLVHFVEHMRAGGAGIRFILDVYIYNHQDELDRQYLEGELKKLNIYKFYKLVSCLSEEWFGDRDYPIDQADKPILLELSQFIVNNGTFGNTENAAALAVKNNRLTYTVQIAFPNYHEMVSIYPWLKKYPFLLPYGWCLRGFRTVIKRKQSIKRVTDMIKYSDSTNSQKINEFYNSIGL